MITLREFKAQDAPFIINTLNDEQVTRYLSSKIPFPYTQADANWWISQGSKNGIIKAIVVNGQFAGCIGITPGEFEYKRSGEIIGLIKPIGGKVLLLALLNLYAMKRLQAHT